LTLRAFKAIIFLFMRTQDFDYHLPDELIAQTPLPRGESRLLVLHRDTGRIEIRKFPFLIEYLEPGDTLVLNDSRVSARRLTGRRKSGQEAEALLLRPRGETEWEALVRPGKRLRPGATLSFHLASDHEVCARVEEMTAEGGRILNFATRNDRDSLATEGVSPLPPYIHASLADEERYQTVYAGENGSAAAPTAGLHFTEDMLRAATAKGVGIAKVTLHVGVDTFRPVKTDEVETHVMHGEWFTIRDEAAGIINNTRGRIVAVGTTSVRVLESAAVDRRQVRAMSGETRLFITPGYEFKMVDRLLTNFHLPKSTLIMLVSALAGRERVLDAYRAAVEAKLRFFSFGDAMLIV
jgi:S-adenosylmethionine:tRNA ribosyltransferase-isomerase